MTSKVKKIISFYRDNLYIIAQQVGFTDVRKYPHNEWMKQIVSGTVDYTLLAHRGSYKSSVLSVCIAFMMVVYPNSNIIFLRKTDTDISEMISMVKKALSSDILNNISNMLYGRNISFVELNHSSITTNLYQSVSGSSQLLGIGIKSSITGKHSTYVITDDICNTSDRTSKAERDKTKTQYQELQNIKNRDGRIINIGTRWHKDDVFTLMPNQHIYSYVETGLIDENKLNDIRKSMTSSLFACNYELKIIASEDVIFQNPNTGADMSQCEQGFCHIDASYGGEDLTAFTVCKKTDGKYYIFGKCWHKHIDDCIQEIKTYYDSLMLGKCYCEDNGDKGYLARDLKKRNIRALTYHENTNKFIKITSHLKFEWENVYFVKGTDEEYISQILDYNENAEHDDCPDSLACCIRIAPNKKQTDYKPIWS